MGYSQVPQVQGQIANTLRSGLAGLGNRPLEQARFGLQKAQIENEIGRQREQDAMAKTLFDTGEPGRELANRESKLGLDLLNRQEAARNTPLTAGLMIRQLFGETPSKETVSQFLAGKKWQKIMEVTGGSMDGNGNLINSKGQPATGADLPKILELATPIIRSGADYGHKVNQTIREYSDITNPTPEQTERYETAVKRKQSPGWMIKQYEAQNEDALRAIKYYKEIGRPTKTLEEDIERRNRKIAKNESVLAKASDRDFLLTLEGVKAGYKAGVPISGGGKATISEALNMFRTYYNVPNEDTIANMEMLGDDAQKEQAAKYRKVLSEKNMTKFFKRLETEGLPTNWGDSKEAGTGVSIADLVAEGHKIMGGKKETASPEIPDVVSDQKAIEDIKKRDKEQTITQRLQEFEASEEFKKSPLDLDRDKLESAKKKVKKQTKKSFLRTPPGGKSELPDPVVGKYNGNNLYEIEGDFYVKENGKLRKLTKSELEEMPED